MSERRWIDDPHPESEDVARAKRLLEDVETPRAPIDARVRVADRLQLARAQEKQRSPMLGFAIAGAVAGALIVFFAIGTPKLPAPHVEKLAEVVDVLQENEIDDRLATKGMPVGKDQKIWSREGGSLMITANTALIGTAEETRISFASIDHLVLATGGVTVRTPATFVVEAFPWTVTGVASHYDVGFEKGALTVNAFDGTVTIDGPTKATLESGERFVSSNAPGKQRMTREDVEEELYQRARDERTPAIAVALFDRVAEMNGAYAEIAAYQAAKVTMKTQPVEKAIARFEKLLADRPNSAYAHEAHLDLLECRITAGQLDRARTELDTILARYPQSERSPELRSLRDQLERIEHRK